MNELIPTGWIFFTHASGQRSANVEKMNPKVNRDYLPKVNLLRRKWETEENLTDDLMDHKWRSIIESRNPLWNKDLTLKEAFRVSCVPCYIRIADKVGEIKYKKYLEVFNYGNKSTMVESTDPNLKIAFWLIEDLRISQEEQISFLRKLYDYRLPVSKHSIDIIKQILVDEKMVRGLLRRATMYILRH